MKTNLEERTVLLLSAPIGSGHKLAAEALVEAFAQIPGIKVEHGNIFAFFPRILGTLFLKGYLLMLKLCPWLYAVMYKWGNHEGGSLWLRGFLNKLLAILGKNYLERVHPDIVLATHATPAGIIAEYKKQHPHIWLGVVVTDFTVHRWWLCEGVDTYFIAAEELRAKFAADLDVQALGIPVRQEFAEQNREEARREYGWDTSERVCLLMGGGEGLLPMEDIVEVVERQPISNLRLVAVCGHNEELVESLQAKYGEQAEVYGFREDVPRMMAAADMIITKPGGLTSSEVLASNLEMIIYKPLPGQEINNAAFLEKHCGAYVAKNLTELRKYVELCVNCKESNVKLGKYAKPYAARDIAKYALREV